MNGGNRRFVAILGMSALLALATTAPATAATIEEVDIFNTLYGTSESMATLDLLFLPDAFWDLGSGATVTAEYKDAAFVQNFANPATRTDCREWLFERAICFLRSRCPIRVLYRPVHGGSLLYRELYRRLLPSFSNLPDT